VGRKLLLKTVQTMTTFRNPLADPLETRHGPPLVRGPQFENRWNSVLIQQKQLCCCWTQGCQFGRKNRQLGYFWQPLHPGIWLWCLACYF